MNSLTVNSPSAFRFSSAKRRSALIEIGRKATYPYTDDRHLKKHLEQYTPSAAKFQRLESRFILVGCDFISLSHFKYGVASGGVRSSSSISTRYGVVTPFALRQQIVFSLPCLDKATGCVQKPLLRLQSFARSHSEDSAPPPFATKVFLIPLRIRGTQLVG